VFCFIGREVHKVCWWFTTHVRQVP